MRGDSIVNLTTIDDITGLIYSISGQYKVMKILYLRYYQWRNPELDLPAEKIPGALKEMKSVDSLTDENIVENIMKMDRVSSSELLHVIRFNLDRKDKQKINSFGGIEINLIGRYRGISNDVYEKKGYKI